MKVPPAGRLVDRTRATTRSARLFDEARQLIPGGVDSPVRAFRGVGGTPRFITRGAGPFVEDADGNRYADYVLSWGPLILGHAHPDVVAAVARQAELGTSYGAPTELESRLAALVIEAVPSVEMVRFVSSGTEATMSALRLARAATDRRKIIKFAGCYHGHADALLVSAGSGVMTLGLPDSPGVTPGAVADTIVLRYNDLEGVEAAARRHADDLAAIIVEPVAGNMGLVLPLPGFLGGLRATCDRIGALLIFDEVMTGFRVAHGGAQAVYGVRPDLTCLGKVIGGGLPAAAFGGRRDVMERLAPGGPVYQAGTLSGNPLAMAAGIATLERIARPGVYEALGAAAARLAGAARAAGARSGVAVSAASAGSMWGFFCTAGPVTDLDSARSADTARYASVFHALLESGVYIAPSQFEAAFVSTAHDESVIASTESALEEAFQNARD